MFGPLKWFGVSSPMSLYASIFGDIWSGRRSDSTAADLRDLPVVCSFLWKAPVNLEEKSPGHPVLRNLSYLQIGQ